MAIKKISSIVQGMILENDAITEKGYKLLPKGIKLTEQYIDLMKRWGVMEASVSGYIYLEDASKDRKSTYRENEKIRKEIETLFSSYDARLVMREFDRIVSRFDSDNQTEMDDYELTQKWLAK